MQRPRPGDPAARPSAVISLRGGGSTSACVVWARVKHLEACMGMCRRCEPSRHTCVLAIITLHFILRWLILLRHGRTCTSVSWAMLKMYSFFTCHVDRQILGGGVGYTKPQATAGSQLALRVLGQRSGAGCSRATRSLPVQAPCARRAAGLGSSTRSRHSLTKYTGTPGFKRHSWGLFQARGPEPQVL